MGDIVVFDTETTGFLQPIAAPIDQQPKMIEFAGIRMTNDYEEVSRLEFLVNPGEPITATIQKITNIDDSMVKNSGPFIDHLADLQGFFFGVSEAVAHNFMFDHTILRLELDRVGCSHKFPWPMIQTCTIEETLGIKNHRLSLSKLHKHLFNESFDGAHRAMVDVEALAKCFIKLRMAGEI